MDMETKTEYVVTWTIRDKNGNVKETGKDYTNLNKEEK